jgi:hypothetical protein
MNSFKKQTTSAKDEYDEFSINTRIRENVGEAILPLVE